MKKLRVNIANLTFLQIANFGLTFVTLPYLTRVLGVDGWGKIVFVQMILNYLIWISNWGFYLSTTRNIAADKFDKNKTSKTFLSAWLAQWLLTLGMIVVLITLINLIQIFSRDKSLYFLSVGLLIANAMMPLWFFNGLERVRDSTVIQIFSKVLALPLIFLFINHKNDLATYFVISTLSSLITGVACLIIIFRSNEIDWHIPKFKAVILVIKDDFQLFLSSMLANINGSLTPTILGFLSGSFELGLFNLADRARGAVMALLNPITQALFLRMCFLFHNDRIEAVKLLKKSSVFLLGLSLFFSLGLFVFSSKIILVLGGADFKGGAGNLRWLSFTPFFTTISSFIINQILIPSKTIIVYKRVTFLTLIFGFITVTPFSYYLSSYGGSIGFLMMEIFTALYLLIYLVNNKKIFEKIL